MKLSTVAISAALAASACTGGAVSVPEATTSPPTVTAATDATITTTLGSEFRVREAGYVLASGEIQSVSPDGRVLLVADGEKICLQSVDGLDVECLLAPPEFRSPPRMVGGWASDGSLFAFQDRNATAATFQSTVWVLNTVEPALDEVVRAEQGILVLDMAVAPEGDEVAMLGNVPDRGHGLFTVTEGNEPRPLAGPISGFDVAWLPDGTALLVTGSTEFADDGLWRADPSDGTVELVTSADDDRGRPSLVAVSNDSATALVYYRKLVADLSANVSYFAVVELENGDVFTLKDAADGDFFGPTVAAFSPDGEWVAYTYHDGDGFNAPLVLAMRRTRGDEEQIISDDLFQAVGSPPPSPDAFIFFLDLRPVWATDDRIVLPTANWALVIDLE